MERIAIALPKGRLLPPTTRLFSGWGLSEYNPLSRNYRPLSAKFPQVFFKVFQEKDIPVQVAVGNYDLGICGGHFFEELLAGYPQSPVIKLYQFDWGKGFLFLACHKSFPVYSLGELKGNSLRLASEFPNLSEAWVLKLRLRHYRLFSLHGAAYVYPPEDADLVVVPASSEAALERAGLRVLGRVTATDGCLIANKESWQSKDLSSLIKNFSFNTDQEKEGFYIPEEEVIKPATIRLALPDGHLQPGAVEFLRGCGFKVDEYEKGRWRPEVGIGWLSCKVIRPQDMPLQVACGNFDLAITGKDWFMDHLCRFPTSPVEKLADFDFGQVRIVAVVHQSLPVENVTELRYYLTGFSSPLKVASEYINLADKYAQENHLSPYRLIPTWGASEAFLPEDADMLIENTQTGQTLVQHNLKVIDTLFQSTACLITNQNSLQTKKEYLNPLIKKLTSCR